MPNSMDPADISKAAAALARSGKGKTSEAKTNACRANAARPRSTLKNWKRPNEDGTPLPERSLFEWTIIRKSDGVERHQNKRPKATMKLENFIVINNRTGRRVHKLKPLKPSKIRIDNMNQLSYNV